MASHRYEAMITALRDIPLRQRIITALDVPGAAPAVELARRLGQDGRFVKVGLELFSAAGPEVIRQLQACGKEVFLDLKYHDIPNTMAGAARTACDLGAVMVTAHASAGRRALSATAAALAQHSGSGPRPLLLAVTVLTSLSAEDWQEISPRSEELRERIVRLARLACDCGCDGVVCSATDLTYLRAELGPGPLAVTPGIRPAATATDDQQRVATPAAAAAAGADFLVIGRPITRAADPAVALAEIGKELPA